MDRGLQELDATEQLSLSFKGSKEGHRQMSGQEARTPAQGLLLFAEGNILKMLRLPGAYSSHLPTRSKNTNSEEFGGDFKDQK